MFFEQSTALFGFEQLRSGDIREIGPEVVSPSFQFLTFRLRFLLGPKEELLAFIGAGEVRRNIHAPERLSGSLAGKRLAGFQGSGSCHELLRLHPGSRLVTLKSGFLAVLRSSMLLSS